MLSRYVVAIQMKISLEDYQSESRLDEHVNRLLRDARKRIPPSATPIVVLPEDIGLGMLFLEDYEQIRRCQTIYEAAQLLLQRYRDRVQQIIGNYGVSPQRALQMLLGKRLEERYRRLFARVARRYRVLLVAGSAPLPHPQQPAEVYNTCYVFDPAGRLLLTQRKVNLIALEQQQGMDLCAGSLQDLRVVDTPVGRVGVAICLDGFYSEVIERLWQQGARLIAQPSFNPLPWTTEQAQGWKMGLWQACQRYPGLVGINPMMVGSLFRDVVVEGCSSIVAHVDKTPDGSGYLAQATTATEEEILVAELPSREERGDDYASSLL